MNLEEFENYYRNGMDEILNQLQTVSLLLAQAEDQITAVNHSVQRLSHTVEDYINQNKAE
jgi:soluble cytochrome b562